MVSLSRRRLLLASLGGGASALGVCGASSRQKRGWHGLTRVERSIAALGTKVSIVALHPQSDLAATAIDTAFRELADVERLLSIYQPQSEVSRLNRDGGVRKPSRHLLRVLAAAEEMSRASDGAFDITIQPVYAVLQAAQREERLPSEAEIAAARECVDWRRVERSEDLVRLRGKGTQITLNGIAQGYATDRMLAVLKDHGIEHALVDGGELAGRGQSADVAAWKVGIQHPREADAFVALAQLDDRALATSGDYATSFSADFRRHHVIDPATGASPIELACVSIAAPTAMEADALSTACFVLGVERSLSLMHSRSHADALFVTKDGHVRATAGFPEVA